MSRVLRKSVILAWLTGGLFFAVAVHAGPYTELYFDGTDLRAGDIFDAHVLTRNVTDVDPIWGHDVILGFAFDLSLPLQGLSFAGATLGPGFEDGSDLLPGHRVAGIAAPLDADRLFGDKILLASLSFECLNAGQFLLGIVSDPDDKNGGLFTWLHHEEIFARLQVNVAPVPEPLSLTLLAGGLIGLAFCRWARREP